MIAQGIARAKENGRVQDSRTAVRSILNAANVRFGPMFENARRIEVRLLCLLGLLSDRSLRAPPAREYPETDQQPRTRFEHQDATRLRHVERHRHDLRSDEAAARRLQHSAGHHADVAIAQWRPIVLPHPRDGQKRTGVERHPDIDRARRERETPSEGGAVGKRRNLGPRVRDDAVVAIGGRNERRTGEDPVSGTGRLNKYL